MDNDCILKFFQAMMEIGQHGTEKYGPLIRERKPGRHKPSEIAFHSGEHFDEYLHDIPHDHFGTLRHQLAAVAFNAMMEFYFAGLEDEP